MREYERGFRDGWKAAIKEARMTSTSHLINGPVKYPSCSVCGIGADGKIMGYVCARLDCPSKVTS